MDRLGNAIKEVHGFVHLWLSTTSRNPIEYLVVWEFLEKTKRENDNDSPLLTTTNHQLIFILTHYLHNATNDGMRG